MKAVLERLYCVTINIWIEAGASRKQSDEALSSELIK